MVPYARTVTLQLSAIGLVVSDMRRTLDFYRALGLEVPENAESEQHVEVTLPGGLRLLFDVEDVIRSFDPGWSPGTGSPRSSLAVACSTPDEVDATYTSLVSQGFEGHLEPWDAFWGQRYASLHDPDGNTVDLFAPLG